MPKKKKSAQKTTEKIAEKQAVKEEQEEIVEASENEQVEQIVEDTSKPEADGVHSLSGIIIPSEEKGERPEDTKPDETVAEAVEEMEEQRTQTVEVNEEEKPINLQNIQTQLVPENLDPVRIVEAALFMSAKPLSMDALAKLLSTGAPGFVKQTVEKLAKEYEEKNSAIKIVEENNEFAMRLKNPYAQLVKDFATEAEVSHGALKILAYISQHEGIEQSTMVKQLGTTVYQYAKELSHNGFIEAKRKGRTKVLRTTKKFKDYFA